MHKFTESIQDLDKAVFKVNATVNKLEDKAQSVEENIARRLDLENYTKMLEMKGMGNQTKIATNVIIDQQYHEEESISLMEHTVE